MTKLVHCQNKVEWDEYILEHEGHPFQLWGWGALKTAHGWTADRLLFYDEQDEIVGAVQLLVKRLPFNSIAYVPRGPVVENGQRDDLLSELGRYVKSNYHSIALSIEPDSIEFAIPKGWVASSNQILPSNTILLDLTKSESDLLAVMAKKTRQYIRKSAAEKAIIKRITDREELTKCLTLYRETSKRAGFALHDDSYYYDVFDKLGEHSQLFASYIGDEPAAFLWLAISASTAYELYGGMSEMGQELRLNYALKWHVIRKCIEWELTRYDFGGLIEGGVTTFKLGWTDQPVDLAGTFDLPLSIFYKPYRVTLPKLKTISRSFKAVFKH